MNDNIMYTLRNKTTGDFLGSNSRIKDAKLYKTKGYLNKLLIYTDYELVTVELKIK